MTISPGEEEDRNWKITT